ncbi:MAG: hypothetical protein KDE35_10130, partial [Geminicoccaceae bacterium]|nr:hypothetical protein [Geminicoccaceae bacterium]
MGEEIVVRRERPKGTRAVERDRHEIGDRIASVLRALAHRDQPVPPGVDDHVGEAHGAAAFGGQRQRPPVGRRPVEAPDALVTIVDRDDDVAPDHEGAAAILVHAGAQIEGRRRHLVDRPVRRAAHQRLPPALGRPALLPEDPAAVDPGKGQAALTGGDEIRADARGPARIGQRAQRCSPRSFAFSGSRRYDVPAPHAKPCAPGPGGVETWSRTPDDRREERRDVNQVGNLLLLPGDGIGPEVMDEVRKVVRWLGDRRGLAFECEEDLVGGCALDDHGAPVSDAAVARALAADAVLFGAVGMPKHDANPFHLKPEQGLLRLRKEMQLFANLRPAMVMPALAEASSLKTELVEGLDILILRELTGG